ncbi:cysteine-rich CWC family protein [Cohnella hongkongensis]|uniref:Cysteine-rich CWC family protein n=1 Tax=Cohnella hongkongensis TaxID=178337 RepID=A0ABV9F5U9_9BACL
MTEAAGKEIDPGACPLCGRDNACGSVARGRPGTCWCSAEKFPPALLDRLPEGARNKACICQACLDAFSTP